MSENKFIGDITNIPSVQKREIGYRSISDSHGQNENESRILSDILDLFNTAVYIKETTDAAVERSSINQKLLGLRIQELEQEVQQTKHELARVTDKDSTKTRIVTPKDILKTAVSKNYALVDYETGSITCKPRVSLSKTNVVEDGTSSVFIPESLKVLTVPDPTDYENDKDIKSSNDTSLKNMFDNDEKTCWFRKLVTNNSVEEATAELIIVLPENIITTKNVNTIILNPFPSGYLDITGIEYKTSNSWYPLEVFKEHAKTRQIKKDYIYGTSSVQYEIQNSPAIRFCFKDQNINQLRIKIKQRLYTQLDDDTRVFYFGFQDIKVLQNIYEDDASACEFAIEFDEPGNIILCQVDAVLNNEKQVDNLDMIKYEYFIIDEFDVGHRIKETVPCVIPTKKLLVRAKLFNNGVSPCVDRFEVKYKIAP